MSVTSPLYQILLSLKEFFFFPFVMRFLLKLRLPVRMMVFQCVTELYNKLFSINLDTYVAFFSLALKWTWLVNVVSNVSGLVHEVHL